MKRGMTGTLWTGLSLIGLGVALLVANVIGWDEVWPVFPILGGVAFLGSYLFGGRKDDGAVFVGVGALLVGLFFFGFTLGYWEWTQMDRLWPVFPLIGGVAFLCQFLAKRRDVGLLGVGLAALIVGGVGLAYTYGYVEGNVVRFWPLLLVLVGLVALFGALFRAARRS